MKIIKPSAAVRDSELTILRKRDIVTRCSDCVDDVQVPRDIVKSSSAESNGMGPTESEGHEELRKAVQHGHVRIYDACDGRQSRIMVTAKMFRKCDDPLLAFSRQLHARPLSRWG
jgi:hypothetical protein